MWADVLHVLQQSTAGGAWQALCCGEEGPAAAMQQVQQSSSHCGSPRSVHSGQSDVLSVGAPWHCPGVLALC